MLQKVTYTISPNDLNINIEGLNKLFDRVCVFDSNEEVNSSNYLQSSKLIAIGSTRELIMNEPLAALEKLQQFCDEKKSWLFGYLSYDLKNEIEQLSSENSDGLAFPLLHFFEPKFVIEIKNQNASVYFDDDIASEIEAKEVYELCLIPPAPPSSSSGQALFKGEVEDSEKINIQAKITRSEYIASVNQLKQHISKGDIYEVNFCQEFFAENANINKVDVYQKLNTISQAPFTAYCKFGTHYLMCASPERFIQKRLNRLISQPIKGTIKRSENNIEDEQLKHELRNNKKEQNENVMIVDLVRNDLSRIAKRGTVEVEELFGVYSFKQVHQLISTVSCELKDDITFTDIIKNMFPMGSMTGAPKISAMKLIEQYESTKRGLYSGAVGYIDPKGDFDFNVVIRSILYNSENKYVSFMVGSAITDKAKAEEEYDECLLKAKAMFEVLLVDNSGSNLHKIYS
jgi:para-aminobenzoate synthetase component 1